MRSSIGFIAMGQGGGNIGSLFEASGYTVFCVNTSGEDLATLVNAKHKHQIKQGEGCNKDRDKAKHLAVKDFAEISSKIEQIFTAEEFIYVIFTAGGGTGSGASPMMIDLLIRQTKKKVGAICVLPSRDEPLKTFINTYECFKELEEIDGVGATFILDNKKTDKFTINKEFVELFNSFIDIPQQHSYKGNVDVAEVKELLSTRGAAVITQLPKNKSDTPGLIQSFKQSIFAPMESDRAITYIGLSSTTDIDMSAITKEVGQPLDIFQGKSTEATICVLCGLTFPYAELEGMKEKVDGSKETIIKSLSATREAKLSDGINFLTDIQKDKGKAAPAKADVSDVFSKYLKK